jgi:hypothetical protein
MALYTTKTDRVLLFSRGSHCSFQVLKFSLQSERLVAPLLLGGGANGLGVPGCHWLVAYGPS